MNGISAYQQMSTMENSKDLTSRLLNSIELYTLELQDISLDWQTRCESGLNAITLVQAMSDNIRSDLSEEEQIILIKVCGQIIKNINRCIRGQQNDLSKELAGIRLIKKLVL